MNCSLCKSGIKDCQTDKHGKKYYYCNYCELITLDNGFYLSSEAEKQRYQLHENSAENKGYFSYLNNIITNSITPFLKPGNKILDFGCGPEKTLAKILKDMGYKVSTFDPHFDNNHQWLNSKYDAITVIEVFEHILTPAKELEVIYSCLNKGSFLIIRTMLHNNNWDNFFNWWYKEDPTHITFYSEKTINYICNRWKFELIQIIGQCEIVLKKK